MRFRFFFLFIEKKTLLKTTRYTSSSLYQVIKVAWWMYILSSQCCFYASLLYSNTWAANWSVTFSLFRLLNVIILFELLFNELFLILLLHGVFVCSTWQWYGFFWIPSANVLQSTADALVYYKCVNDPTIITIGGRLCLIIGLNIFRGVCLFIYIYHWIPMCNARSSLMLYSNIVCYDTHRCQCAVHFARYHKRITLSTFFPVAVYLNIYVYMDRKRSY